MKKNKVWLLWAVALAALAALLFFVNRSETLPEGAKVGDQLPDFTAVCTDGGTFTLSEQRGKVVVINLWATWCTPCVKELPNFDRLLQERKNVAVLAVHAPPVTTDVADYLSAYSYAIPFAVDADGSLSERLGASTVLPQTIVLSPDGVVTCNRAGALTYEELLSLVEAAEKN